MVLSMHKKNRVKNFMAFSLSEVLIALGIIGVVAAMTLPMVLRNTHNHQYVAGYKKALYSMTNAMNMITSESGGSILGAYNSEDEFLDAMCLKLNCNQACHSYDNRKECFHTASDWRTLGGGGGWINYATAAGQASALLPDGMMFNIGDLIPNCTTTNGSINNICAILTVDINGFHPPNMMGRDMFQFFVEPNKVEANGNQTGGTGYTSDPSDCDPTSGTANDGINCGTKISTEGNMNY